MKVTKVNKIRSAVSGKKTDEKGRGILYPTPNAKNHVVSVEKQIENRVKNANNLYSVFFKSDTPDKKTEDLEAVFTVIMRMLAEKRDKSMQQKIDWMQNDLKYVILNKGKKAEKKIFLNEFKLEHATEDRMKAVLGRMRKSLKRGTNGEVAVQLLQGLAQVDGRNLSMVLAKMQKNPMQKEALEKFFKAVEEDYYKARTVKSIKNHDVKVQVHDGALDLSSLNIEKVSEKKKYKAGLTKTLELYAASKESSDQVLKDIKGILIEYFMWEDSEVRKAFTTDEKLWNIPNRTDEYFDQKFIAIDDKASKKPEACEDLRSIWNRKPVKAIEIKNRINYVNCGKYQQMMKRNPDEFREYWITFAKDFVEKNYVKKKKRFTQEECCSTAMLLECWKDAIRFLCGKYIDIGKAVYHFAMPEEMSPKQNLEYGVLRPEYHEGISSFEYEAIKAEENIQRDIAIATVAAASAFSRSVVDVEKQAELDGAEDVLLLKEEQWNHCVKDSETVKRQLLRFYGGYSTIKGSNTMDGNGLAKELVSHIKAIRNENFHFTNGKKVPLSTAYTEKLWENEKNVYQQVIREKYYFNNVAMFYPEATIKALVKKLYAQNILAEAQIPAFRNVWKRKDLPEDIKDWSLSWQENDSKQVIFLGALYFLLKEIYYYDFIVSKEAGAKFFAAVKSYVSEVEEQLKKSPKDVEKKNLVNAGRSFQSYVEALKEKYKKGELTFGNVCQFINAEYNQQNSKQSDVEIYKHFKILLPMCLKRAFQDYVNENYAFVKKPSDAADVTVTYLNDVQIACMEMDKEHAHWFTFAHFIHPKQLNLLIGNFKNYIQYKQDVLRRAGYAGQLNDAKERKRKEKHVCDCVERAERILNVLEFVCQSSGRVSNHFGDYYQNKAEYVKYMSAYMDFTVKDNPELLRNVEMARMYAGGDLVLPGYEKISKAEIQDYDKNKDTVAQIQANGICKSKEAQKQVVDFQKRKERITLNEVTELYSLVNDLLGELVSLAYLRERDQMYLFLGFYYMALRSNGWKNEVLNQVNANGYKVAKGLALYQTVGVFDFGTKLLCYKNGVWTTDTRGNKWGCFIRNHEETYHCIMRLFGITKHIDEIQALRAYVDHSKYYVKYDLSILELYSQFYTKFFGYSTKLRKSVLFNFQSTLEKHFVDAKLRFDDKDQIILDEETKSMVFSYKYEAKDKKGKETTKTLQLPAKSQTFMDGMFMLLQYKK